jgi:hypothetical protein
LDQFPKWNPVNREAFIDRLSARYSVWDSKVFNVSEAFKTEDYDLMQTHYDLDIHYAAL